MTPLSKHTDDALVRLYIAGQNEAFDELLLHYSPDKGFLKKVVGHVGVLYAK